MTNAPLAPADQFPSLNNVNFLGYCSVSPLSRAAAERATHAVERQLQVGRGMLFEYSADEQVGRRFHRNFGQLLKTDPSNLSMVTNTSQALSMVANGYPWRAGDEILSYTHEYPANHYPWVVQSRQRDVNLVLLGDAQPDQQQRRGTGPLPDSLARGWSFEELESKVTDRTRMIAISHVQFTSGFAADLPRLGAFCRERGIDLVVDAAQGLGCLPLYPDEYGISCVAAAGWKWLVGPVGSAVMFTTPEFREKIEITMTGADHMHQDTEYLDHTWAPYSCGRKFEFSTVPYALLDGLSVGVEQVFLPHTLEAIRDYVHGLHDLAIENLDNDKYQPVVHQDVHRSGILSIVPRAGDAKAISAWLDQQGIVITPRDGYLRLAPHLCTPADQVMQAVEALNAYPG